MATTLAKRKVWVRPHGTSEDHQLSDVKKTEEETPQMTYYDDNRGDRPADHSIG